MQRMLKLAIAILVFWAACAVLVWLVAGTGSGLVAPRKPGLPHPPNIKGDVSRVRAAATVLAETNIWGLQRDGRPLAPPPVAGAEAGRKITWSVVATVIAKDQHFVLVRVDKETPRQVLVGEHLPDGSKLLKVMPNAYTVVQTEGDEAVEMSHFIASGK